MRIDIRGDYSPYVLKGPFEATDPDSYLPGFSFSGLCAPSAQVRPVICW
jgi:hypothetical protein